MISRTEFSFKKAFGKLDDVVVRLKASGAAVAAISDRASTFGFVRWDKAARKAGLRPVFGVEFNVVPQLGDKKPVTDSWTFLAIDDLRPLHDLVYLATANPGGAPSLTYNQALAAPGLIKIAGERCLLQHARADASDFFIGLSPATNRGLFNRAAKAGFRFFARSDNLYPSQEDKELYRVALGRNATTQTYPQHILTDDEWLAALRHVAPEAVLKEALANRDEALSRCCAELKRAVLLKPERPASLRAMCETGAAKLGCNLADPVYAARLDRELTLIAEKQFEDYFYIIADLVSWAKQRMLVGPGRGSSAGSLVCYLLGITAIDPIPNDLLFERFIDITRTDNPDIDLDFDDARREQVFDYLYQKYGKHRVARLGAAGSMQPRSAMKAVGAALKIPPWEVERALDRVPRRTAGDDSNDALEEFFNTTDGKDFAARYPNAIVAAKLEGHASNATKHAAGVLLTNDDIRDIVAIDARNNTAMCDLKDAEQLNLLKIDALGLIQLSIFQRTQDLIDGKA